MNLKELEEKAILACEYAEECGEDPRDIKISLQIDGPKAQSICAAEDVELHYDNDCQASGCVLVGEFTVITGWGSIWKNFADEKSPHGIPVLAWHPDWVHEDFNPTGVREGFWCDEGYFMSCGWDSCNDVFTTEDDIIPYFWAEKIMPTGNIQKG